MSGNENNLIGSRVEDARRVRFLNALKIAGLTVSEGKLALYADDYDRILAEIGLVRKLAAQSKTPG
ncbi:MAG: hypothetical protein ABTQ30_13000 [Rhizobiaceae bacterium]